MSYRRRRDSLGWGEDELASQRQWCEQRPTRVLHQARECSGTKPWLRVRTTWVAVPAVSWLIALADKQT